MTVEGAPLVVEGDFTHTCVVPEPGTFGLLLVGATTLVGVAWQRGCRRNQPCKYRSARSEMSLRHQAPSQRIDFTAV
jgi:hypothetical protein